MAKERVSTEQHYEWIADVLPPEGERITHNALVAALEANGHGDSAKLLRNAKQAGVLAGNVIGQEGGPPVLYYWRPSAARGGRAS